MLVTTLTAQIALIVFALVYAASIVATVLAARDPRITGGEKAAWATALLLLPPFGLAAWALARVVVHRAAHPAHAAAHPAHAAHV